VADASPKVEGLHPVDEPPSKEDDSSRMDARWTPILAAAIGVVGGVGGALVGGFWVNQGQEEGFERERAAAIQDLRIKEYRTFMGTADELSLTLLAYRPVDEISETYRRLLVAKAGVLLVETEGGGVGTAAFSAFETLRKAVDARNAGETDEMERLLEYVYPGKIVHFLGVARADTERTQE
jgi:hypothetical protein